MWLIYVWENWIINSFEITTYHLSGVSPLLKPILIYYQSNLWKQNALKIEKCTHIFISRKCIWKCRMQNGAILTRPQCVKLTSIAVFREIISGSYCHIECWYQVCLLYAIFIFAIRDKRAGPRLNIKTVLSTYGDFHVKDKTAVRTSYL